MSKEHILKEVINGYREVIEQRYQYATLRQKYDLPPSVDEETVNLLRNFFLDYVYPKFEEREELNQAFNSLDAYIRKPDKLVRLLIESVKLIYKYGRHLPKVLRTGLTAFRSFNAATAFEDKLVENAISMELNPPFHEPDIKTLLRSLPREEIETFIEGARSLFETIHDRVLVAKIKDITKYLISRLKEDPAGSTAEEIRGLEIGLEIIRQGDLIFAQLTEEDQDRLIPLVVQIERDVLDELFGEDQETEK